MPITSEFYLFILPALKPIIFCNGKAVLETMQQIIFKLSVFIRVRNEIAYAPLAAEFDRRLTGSLDPRGFRGGEFRCGDGCIVFFW